MGMITVTAGAVDEVVTKMLIEPETTSDKLEYEVVDKGSTGFFGIDAKPIIIRARKKESIEDKVVDLLSQIFGVTGIQVNITAAYNQGKRESLLSLEGGGMGVLIGKRNQALDSLQYLMSLAVNKGTEGYLRVKLDTKNYRERRKETLEVLVKNIAYKTKRTRRPVSLEPMNSYERKIIHVALQNDKYVTTKSEGERPFRHVAIALKKETASDDCKGRCDRDRGGRYERPDRSGGYRNSRHTDGSNASQVSSDAPAETTVGEEE